MSPEEVHLGAVSAIRSRGRDSALTRIEWGAIFPNRVEPRLWRLCALAQGRLCFCIGKGDIDYGILEQCTRRFADNPGT